MLYLSKGLVEMFWIYFIEAYKLYDLFDLRVYTASLHSTECLEFKLFHSACVLENTLENCAIWLLVAFPG